MKTQLQKEYEKIVKEEKEAFKHRMYWINLDNQLQARKMELGEQLGLYKGMKTF